MVWLWQRGSCVCVPTQNLPQIFVYSEAFHAPFCKKVASDKLRSIHGRNISKDLKGVPSGLSHMSMLLKTFASCLTSPKEVLPDGNITIAYMDLSYPIT
jgi:hypothetical protein